jgi:hypothetical protein
LLYVGQFIGAAQIARSQLERWALNIEYATRLTKDSRESVGNYYDRLWSSVDDLAGVIVLPEHQRNPKVKRKLPVDGREASPGELYEDVSEFLHGRGAYTEAVYFEACDLLRGSGYAATLEIGNKILDVLELVTQRIRSCVMAIHLDSGETDKAAQIGALSCLNEPAGSDKFPSWSLWPLVPYSGLAADSVALLRANRELLERVRRGERPAGRLYDNGEISDLFFLDRRARSVETALRSLELEERMLGEPLNLESLFGREFQKVVCAEVLGLVAKWEQREAVASAAACASTGLRTGFWLWLEDDDRAMGVLRVVLESVARLRTWNKRPDKAAKLEARGRTTPGQWLEEAGWSRLNPLNRALGEMIHVRANSRWNGARSLLTVLQPPDVDPNIAPFRARGFALDSVTTLAARTVLETVGFHSIELQAELSNLMRKTGIFSEEINKRLEQWLDRAHSNKKFDFGEPDLDGPAAEARRAGEARPR